jgi:mono/diheme cytochrome c family protein
MKRFALHLVVLLSVTGVIILTQARAWGQEQKTSPKTNASANANGQGRATEMPSKSSDDSLAGNVENGKKFFMTDGCFECHGTVGQGATATGGARIGPPAISFEELVEYVHHPSGQMPPYTSKVISDQDLADIYAYLKSQPKPPSGKSIPLLNQ